MAFEGNLRAYLLGYAGLAALVGTRIHGGGAPQGETVPYCVYVKISNVRQYAMGGYAGIQRHRMQISCYGATYDSAKAVAAQVIAALEPWSSTEVQAAFQEDEEDIHEPETKLHHIPVDFLIWGS